MPVVDVINLNKEKVGQIDLPADIYDVPVRPHLMHEVVVAIGRRRAGSASTKTPSDISGSTKKPYRQNGTGRARPGPASRLSGVEAAPFSGRNADYSFSAQSRSPRSPEGRSDLQASGRRVMCWMP
jgi:large subunit ribosomal protein L4